MKRHTIDLIFDDDLQVSLEAIADALNKQFESHSYPTINETFTFVNVKPIYSGVLGEKWGLCISEK